jgi:hypothetical protein
MSEKEILEVKKLKIEIWTKRISNLAVFGAAVWALYTFDSLREIYIAEAKVTDYESRNVSLNLSISQNEIVVDNKGRIGVELVVNIENKGILPIDVDLTGNETFTLSHIVNVLYKLEEKENIQSVEKIPVGKVYSSKAYNRLTQTAIRKITSTSVRPNSTNTVRYFFYVDEPGVYLASFISVIPKDVLDKMNSREIGDHNEVVTESSAWMAQKFIKITGVIEKEGMDGVGNK